MLPARTGQRVLLVLRALQARKAQKAQKEPSELLARKVFKGQKGRVDQLGQLGRAALVVLKVQRGQSVRWGLRGPLERSLAPRALRGLEAQLAVLDRRGPKVRRVPKARLVQPAPRDPYLWISI